MEESEYKSSSERGVTLIEVMISLLIFSIMLGLCTGLIKKGTEQPHMKAPPENWLVFIDESTLAARELTDIKLLNTGQSPLKEITPPPDLAAWEVTAENTHIETVDVAVFTAKTKGGRKIEWRIYRKY